MYDYAMYNYSPTVYMYIIILYCVGVMLIKYLIVAKYGRYNHNIHNYN